MKKFIFNILIPLLIVAVGAGVGFFLSNQATKAEFTAPEDRVLSVTTLTVKTKSMIQKITTSGTVVPARQIQLIPEVSGRLTYVSPRLIPGSRFEAGEIVARINKQDYALALEQQKGQVEQAQLNLTMEQSRGQVAEKEWALLRSGANERGTSSSLALRKPQLEEARQRTASAQSSLQRAKLNLKRTILRAPFDAMVVQKNVDEGQLVGPTTPVTTLMGTEELWVNLSVPVEQLGAFAIPGFNSEHGAIVDVIQQSGGQNTIHRKGVVYRLHGQLDNLNRTATVLVSVKKPFDTDESALPLLAGAYVDAVIMGQETDGAMEIPRKALHEGSYVWTVQKNVLKKAAVDIYWTEQETVVLKGGLTDGDEIVTSPATYALEGMTVSRQNDTGALDGDGK